MSRKSGLWLGIILGAALGVAFAPKKGKEIREELSADLKKGGMGEKVLKETAISMGQEIADTAKEIYHNPEVQKKLSGTKKEAQKVFNQVQKNIQENKDDWIEIAREQIIKAKKNLAKEYAKKTDSEARPATKPASSEHKSASHSHSAKKTQHKKN